MKSTFASSCFSIGAIAAVLLSACSQTRPGTSDASGETAVTVKGSDTMVNLSAAWAEAFMAKHPGAMISVTGGGSGTGVSALLGGSADICNASRDITPEEKEKGAAKGINVVEHNVAMDGIAIVVHPENPLAEISIEQLRQIYTGQITNWETINGQDMEIVVLSRETSSGTYLFFQEHVLLKKDYTPSARLMPATASIIESTASDKGSIGYVGLGYALNAKERVKTLPVKKDAASAAIGATEEAIHSGEYPIARALHCYTNGAPAGIVAQFMEYCLSAEGQAVVREQGFISAK